MAREDGGGAEEVKRGANWEEVGAEVPPKMNGEEPAVVEGEVAAAPPELEREPGEVISLVTEDVVALVAEDVAARVAAEEEESTAMAGAWSLIPS